MTKKMAYDPDVFAEWWFLADQEILNIVQREARNVANKVNGTSDMADDLEQEAYLYLAVRPRLQHKTYGNLCLNIQRYLMKLAITEERNLEHDSLEDPKEWEC